MALPNHEHTRTGRSVDVFKRALLDNLYYIQGKEPPDATRADFYYALAYTVRDRMLKSWLQTGRAQAGAKRVNYLSAEYLLGRQLENNLLSEDLDGVARAALGELGLDLDLLMEVEAEPGLGNGGLGRLAACFLDSLATLDLPAVGYGIRYEFGIFRQTFEDGWQVEQPDDWLGRGNPWEFPHHDMQVLVGFGGHTEPWVDELGRPRTRWHPARNVYGVPYNMMVPGYATETVNTLRLWSARATHSFNLQIFNAGDYARAVEDKAVSENISKVLYPDDSTEQGRQLRLEQQYFFVACSLKDMMRSFQARNDDWTRFPQQMVIQLNDTHPSIAVAELMRLLVDEEGLNWEQAWAITRQSFGYTVHTLMPEALEEWPVGLFGRVLPRHLEIIYEINRHFLEEVRARFPDQPERIGRMSILRDGTEQRVRMAYLACVGSFAINGVAELHSQLLRDHTLRDFAELWPEKFSNKTNGITPRRFVKLSNGPLARLVTDRIGDGWLTDLEQLRQLEPLADDPAFRAAWREVKFANKQVLATYIGRTTGVAVEPTALFDVMVKRLHEYKRQLLKALHIVTVYNRLRQNPEAEIVPRVFVFGAKAAPAYWMAKRIIKLINAIAATINHDPALGGRLRIAFLPNYNVAVAERIYPAADLSEQISLAGKEASGTGNMKMALNGALTIGTLDGANIELRDRVGAENFFLFGLTTPEVFALQQDGYRPLAYYERYPELRQALDLIGSGFFSRGDRELFRPIIDSLLQRDEYLLLADYHAYLACQDRVDRAYRDQEAWTRMSILNTARSGFFSSDRTIRQYCEDIWQVKAVAIAPPQS